LIPASDVMAKEDTSREHRSSVDSIYLNNDRMNENCSAPMTFSSIDNLFPSPGVIIKDIVVNTPGTSRESADRCC